MPTAYDYINDSRYFTRAEWPDPTVLTYVDARVLEALDDLRERHARPLHPSRHPEGWIRFNGSEKSRHYVGGGQLSTAADFFPEGDVRDCLLHAVADPRWGGFGIYLDTKRSDLQPGPMMHLDLREGPRVFWVRTATGRYVYKNSRAHQFWMLIAEAF
tara:strand:- start:224 stop:697 length:474 start_codon:yes stop_codon:yes gene_type:complete